MLRESRPASAYAELFQRYPEWCENGFTHQRLAARDWPYPAHTVFNAGACEVGGETVLLVRGRRGRWPLHGVEDRRGHSHLTAARSQDGVTNRRIDAKPSFAPDPPPAPKKPGAWKIRA